MIRAGYEMLPVAQWTDEEALDHLAGTFDMALDERPDLMEPYVVMLADADDDQQRVAIMRRGLRETIKLRFPVWSSK